MFRWARLFLGLGEWACVRCTWARAITFLASGAISTCLLGAGLVRAWSPSLVL